MTQMPERSNYPRLRCLLAGFLILPAFLQGHAQRCDAERAFSTLLATDSALAARHQQIETFTENWIAARRDEASSGKSGTIVQIPVVLHIVWQTPAENIAPDQIQSQLDVLAEDFRLLNNLSVVPESFLPLAADLELEFCLARRTPDGEPTDGIVRVQTAVNNVGTAMTGGERVIYYSELGGSDAWDPSSYLNIWIGRRQFFPGEASFPAEGIANPAEDGVVIDPEFFGSTGSVNPPYHLGRTLTHEIGHYFNLFHLWGPGGEGSCLDDDEVADTPLQSVTYLGECPATPQLSCGSPDMYMNYMNFTDDACMGMFSLGQKLRMLAALNGPRSGLLVSDGCLPPLSTTEANATPIHVYPNPTRENIRVELPPGLTYPAEVRLLAMDGRSLLSREADGPGVLELDLTALNPGFYLIKMTAGTEIFTKKLIIVR